jgi:hypothetical protein
MSEPKRNADVLPLNMFISKGDFPMGRGILLWLLGIPLPIIILLALFAR